MIYVTQTVNLNLKNLKSTVLHKSVYFFFLEIIDFSILFNLRL